jgi:FKBP-type peptidyl-prolyl cis-trans isomerase
MAFTLVAADRAVGASPDSTTNSAGFAESDLIETWGWLVAQQEEAASIEVNSSELRSLIKGFSSGIHGGPAPCDLSQVNPDVERLRKARRAKQVRAVEKRNESEASAFFDALKKNPRVAALPGGVNYEIIRPGNGVFPAPRQTVNVHFTAHLLDGTEFAQLGPMDMVLVTNHAPFAAWVAGLQKVKTGGAIRFYVPPPLPEKEALRWGIPPGSAMIFEVELLKARDTTEQELADELIAPAPELELPASGFSTAMVFEAWGWIVAQKTRAAQFNLNDAELSALADGMQSGIAGRTARSDLERIRPAVEKFVNDHRELARIEAKRKQLAETEALFAELKRNTNVVELADGLRYEILQPGTGPYPKPGQLVKVNYTGRLIDGRIFDQTDPSLGPLDIKVGSVIAGWSEGVQKINRGGKIKLYIPPALGYGEVSTGGIPANSTLIFEIEILDIKNSVD